MNGVIISVIRLILVIGFIPNFVPQKINNVFNT